MPPKLSPAGASTALGPLPRSPGQAQRGALGLTPLTPQRISPGILSHPGLLAYAGRGGVLPTVNELEAMVDAKRFMVPAQAAYAEGKQLAKQAAGAAQQAYDKVSALAKKGYDKGREKHEQRSVDTPFVQDADTQWRYVGFKRGTPVRPTFSHDHGFLDTNGKLDPKKRTNATSDDYYALAQWIMMLEGAELVRPDLIDGTGAYRHFLMGHGRSRTINYERYVQNDSSGKTLLESAMKDARTAAIALHDELLTQSLAKPRTDLFQMYSDAFSTGELSARFPYPATENWQKAIGDHKLWMKADVVVDIDPSKAERRFKLKLTIEMEDMYNFNPNMKDMATGTPDAENGRFERTGLGYEYLNIGSITRSFTFFAPIGPVSQPKTAGSQNYPESAPRHGPPSGPVR